MNAIVVLAEEHQKLRPFLNQIRTAADHGNDDTLNDAIKVAHEALNEDLDRHISLEDDDVFPRIAEHLSPAMVQAFIDDHREIQRVRDKLYATRGNESRSLALTLEELLQDHLEREENMLFPAAESNMTQQELDIDA